MEESEIIKLYDDNKKELEKGICNYTAPESVEYIFKLLAQRQMLLNMQSKTMKTDDWIKEQTYINESYSKEKKFIFEFLERLYKDFEKDGINKSWKATFNYLMATDFE